MDCRLYVGNISYDARSDDIQDLFDGNGKIKDIDIKMGYAFVEFEEQEDAKRVYENFNGILFGGKKICVNFATDKTYKSYLRDLPSSYLSTSQSRSPSSNCYSRGYQSGRGYSRGYHNDRGCYRTSSFRGRYPFPKPYHRDQSSYEHSSHRDYSPDRHHSRRSSERYPTQRSPAKNDVRSPKSNRNHNHSSSSHSYRRSRSREPHHPSRRSPSPNNLPTPSLHTRSRSRESRHASSSSRRSPSYSNPPTPRREASIASADQIKEDGHDKVSSIPSKLMKALSEEGEII